MRNLEKEMAAHSVFLPGESRGQRKLTIHGVTKRQHDSASKQQQMKL